MYSPEYMERLTRMRNAIKFQHNDRIPTLSSANGWMAYDSGLRVRDAYYDYKVAREVVKQFVERYQFDSYIYTYTVHNLAATKALGGGSYHLDPKTDALYATDHTYLYPEEYSEYAKDPIKYLRKCFARKYPNMTTQKFANALQEFLNFSQWGMQCDKMMREELKTTQMNSMASSCMSPLELLNASLRGMKDVAIDMRRHKGALKEYLDATWEKMLLPGVQGVMAAPSNDDFVVDVYIAMLAHSFLNVRQFEELYWPYMKKVLDMAVENNKTVYIFCENSMMRFKEFFQDIPKGTVVMHLEDDDIRQVRKELPNLCLAGGMPLEHLGYGTPEQCVDDAKRLIDDMGDGYILSMTKNAAYKDDMKRENLLAVMEFCREYKL